MLIYISGKYSGQVAENIAVARKAAVDVWNAGHTALCPHLNTAGFEEECQCTYSDYIVGDLNLLSRCDAILMLPGWEGSRGAKIERAYALKNQIPVYLYPVIPPLHLTETTRPVQVDAFRNLMMRMYRTHLDKNADYSPANILGCGFIGVVTRIWDKVCRLMNLSGFHVEVTFSGYTSPREPKNESIDDNLIDLAVYAMIGSLLRSKKWGR